MTVYLYDALYPAGIPLDIEPDAIVASYIDHPEVIPPCMTQLASRFPNRTRVGISAHGHPAAILDCERGAILPASVPALVTASRAAGFTVAVYASPTNWALTGQACDRADIDLPLWWSVVRTSAPFIPVGACGNQYLGAGPYDKSIITDEWAQILSGAAPSGGGQPIPTPAPPAPTPEDGIVIPTVYVDNTAGDPNLSAAFADLGGGVIKHLSNLEYQTAQGLGWAIKPVDAAAWLRLENTLGQTAQQPSIG